MIVEELISVNEQIKELNNIKQRIENELIKELNHEHEGSKTYNEGVYKINIKTDFIYSVDKEKYLEEKELIPPEFNPIIEKVSYSVDKNKFKDATSHNSTFMSEIITIKPAKPYLTISRINE